MKEIDGIIAFSRGQNFGFMLHEDDSLVQAVIENTDRLPSCTKHVPLPLTLIIIKQIQTSGMPIAGRQRNSFRTSPFFALPAGITTINHVAIVTYSPICHLTV